MSISHQMPRGADSPASTSAERPAFTDTGAQPDLDPELPSRSSELSKPSLLAVVKRAGKEFKHDNLTVLAAALSYYGILSVVPGLIVLFAILGLLGANTTHQLVQQVQSVAPGSSAHFVNTLIKQAQADKKDAGIGAVIAILIALWSASGYVAAFRRASNIIYDIGEGRPLWKTLPLRFGVTIVAVVILVLAAVITVVSGPIAKQVGNSMGVGSTTVQIWNVAKWPLLFFLDPSFWPSCSGPALMPSRVASGGSAQGASSPRRVGSPSQGCSPST